MESSQETLRFQHHNLLKQLKTLVGHFTIPDDATALEEQHRLITAIYSQIQQIGGDNRRRHRGSREQKLPQGSMVRQRLHLSNNNHHDLILKKEGIHLVDQTTGRKYTSLHKANEEHYVSCGRVWTNEDEEKNPRHKSGSARNPVSAWGNGKNTQGFYALRKDTKEQYDIPIVDINDDVWFAENLILMEHTS